MNMREIREQYGVPAKRGMRVMGWSYANDELVPRYGRITSVRRIFHFGWCLMVRLDGDRAPIWHHPHYLVYYDVDGRQIWPVDGRQIWPEETT
jgi:hypothetical protein